MSLTVVGNVNRQTASPGRIALAPDGEAERLCRLIDEHADSLRGAALGKRFTLDGATFRLFAVGRNTIYRVSAQSSWFLRLSRSGDVRFMDREQRGARAIGAAVGKLPEYCGAAVIRVAVEPAYVLASAIPGTPLNAALATEAWLPGAAAAARLEALFATLGTLLATLHAEARNAPGATASIERPFEALQKLLDQHVGADSMSDEIRAWHDAHKRSDDGPTFVHGNMRLDNVLKIGNQLGFIDFEHCGSGTLYQDLSRPVSQLLMTRMTLAFPRERASRCLRALLEHYRRVQPFDIARLSDHVGGRLAHSYLRAQTGGATRGRVAGMPVIKSKVDSVTRAVLREGIHGVLSTP
jgi:Ser/Thr protein kinase RdoA (MazF antagonist)